MASGTGAAVTSPPSVAAASAIAKGRGSRPRRRAPASSSGAIAMIRMSLASTADSAPPILIARGDAALAARPCVAVVGARNASAGAVKLAREFGECLIAPLARRAGSGG